MLDGRGAQILKVGDLLKENLLIPDYQRPYKWTRRNVSDLLSDISVVVSSEKIRQYRVGTVILRKNGDSFDVVDGQQRILTLILISIAIDHAFSCSIMRDKRFRREITHSATTQQNLHDNFGVIRDFFANDESLKLRFKDAIETVLEAVVVCVDRDREAFQLFDSQNTRGRRLDPHDLLKAFHLREMRGRKYDMEYAVTRWESVESREIRELFAWYLYPIQNWMKQEKSGDFTEKEIGEFKGVPENSPYSYGRRTVKAMPCYQIGEQFIAGEDFFGLVDYYLRVRQNIEREIFRNPSLAAVASVLNCPDVSTGFKYAKRLFFGAVMCYFDRFDNFDSRAISKLCLWAFMLRIDMEHLGYDTINKYAVGDDPNGRYSNCIPMFVRIVRARTHLDIVNVAVNMSKQDRKPELRKKLEALYVR